MYVCVLCMFSFINIVIPLYVCTIQLNEHQNKGIGGLLNKFSKSKTFFLFFHYDWREHTLLFIHKYTLKCVQEKSIIFFSPFKNARSIIVSGCSYEPRNILCNFNISFFFDTQIKKYQLSEKNSTLLLLRNVLLKMRMFWIAFLSFFFSPHV